MQGNPPQQTQQEIFKAQLALFHKQQIFQSFNSIHQAITVGNFSQVIQLLQKQQSEIINEIDLCSAKDGVDKQDQQFVKSIKAECVKIKERNKILLKKMLNLRETLTKRTFAYSQKNKKIQIEYNQSLEKFRKTKAQLAAKIHNLKMLPKQTEHHEEDKSIKIPLIQLKDGVQLLEKQSMSVKQDMTLVIQYLNQSSR